MSTRQERLLAPLALALALAGCGGAGGQGAAEPEAGAASPGSATTGGQAGSDTDSGDIAGNPDSATGGTTGSESGGNTDTSDENAGTTESTSLSGRVADGYIRGAVVCVDLNENRECDGGEPSAVTGEGGVFELALTGDFKGKPIVAAIPPEAIDEDTGQAVGEKRVFVAPAERPGFVSPITTLVDERLRNDPTLDIDDAERAIKEDLGLDGDSGVSLFDDYLAEANSSGDTGRTFRYLHETARVVADLLGGVRADVERGALEAGIDLGSDTKARRAIGAIVGDEIRRLLPQIAREVSQLVDAAESGSAGTDVNAEDRAQLAEILFPSNRLKDIEARVRNESDSEPVAEADMQSILEQGIFWIDSDCHSEKDAESDLQQDDVAGSPNEQDCAVSYAEASLGEGGTRLNLTYHDYNTESGEWTPEASDSDFASSRLALAEGRWIPIDTGEAGGSVLFDGKSAVVREAGAELRIRGRTTEVQGSPVSGHLWRTELPVELIESTDATLRFADQASIHSLSISETPPEYVLLGAGSDGDPSCDHLGVCPGVVELAEAPARPETLEQVRIGALAGIELGGLAREAGSALPVVVTLSGERGADGSLPTAGDIHWQFVEESVQNAVDEQVVATSDPEELSEAQQPQLDLSEGDKRYVTSSSAQATWSLIRVQGVDMIELSFPRDLRARLDLEGESSLLLIEHGGVVNAGARYETVLRSTLTAYDPQAFGAIREVVETYLAPATVDEPAAGDTDSTNAGDVEENPEVPDVGDTEDNDSELAPGGTAGAGAGTDDREGEDADQSPTTGDSVDTTDESAEQNPGRGWLVNTDAERSKHIMEPDSNQGVVVNVESVTLERVDERDYVKVATRGVPNYRTLADKALLSRLGLRPDQVADFRNGAVEIAEGDEVLFGQDIGYTRSSENCTATGGAGYWPPGQECPTAQPRTALFPAKAIDSKVSCETGAGAIGWFANGTSMHNWHNGQSYLGQGVWRQAAPVAELLELDICGGQASDGDYHHHSWSSCLASQMEDTGAGHSPRYGVAADGYPVHGPWFAAGILAASSWVARDYDSEGSPSGCGSIGERSCVLVDPYDLSRGTVSSEATGPRTDASLSSRSGNPLSAKSGLYFEDYYHDAELAASADRFLDESNGHEHGDLGYHYHLTLREHDGGERLPAFPYSVGPRFRGQLEANSLATCVTEAEPGGEASGGFDPLPPPPPPPPF